LSSLRCEISSERKFKEILKCFCIDLTATQTSNLTGLNRNTVNKYYAKFRERIVELCNIDSPFGGEIEVDESYFCKCGFLSVTEQK